MSSHDIAVKYFCIGTSLGLIIGFVMGLVTDVGVSLLLSGLVVFVLALVLRNAAVD